jgi:lipoprotein-anchoring transpeptidase ErfK/SrfK
MKLRLSHALVLGPVLLLPAAALAVGGPTPPAAASLAQAADCATRQPAPTVPTPSALSEDAFTVWHGVVRAAGANRRSAPDGSAPILGQLDPGTPIRIAAWVAGSMEYPDVITWGQVAPADGGGYLFGGTLAGVLPAAVPPLPPDLQGRTDTWLDVNLTLNVLTAYQDGQPVKVVLVSPGRPGHLTDLGRFAITSKLPAQDMVGPDYDVPGVPWVQYFSGAEALHGRYWTLPEVVESTSADVAPDGSVLRAEVASAIGSGPNVGVAFGVPSSHGCLGMQVDDAAWLYSLTDIGTLVAVHP